LRWIARGALVVYLGLMYDLTLIRFQANNPGFNLIPLRTIIHDFRNGGTELLVNTVGNVAAFVPFGILVAVGFGAWVRSARRVALASFGLSLMIELAQARSGRRVADVDDLILNTLGGLVGYGLLRAWDRLRVKMRSGSGNRSVRSRSVRPPMGTGEASPESS